MSFARWKNWFYWGAYEAKITDVILWEVCFTHCNAHPAVWQPTQWEWVTGCFQVGTDPLKKAQNILGCWGISTSSSSLIEDDCTNGRSFPTIPSHWQNQHQRSNLYKIYVTSFIVVPAYGAHLFIFLT